MEKALSDERDRAYRRQRENRKLKEHVAFVEKMSGRRRKEEEWQKREREREERIIKEVKLRVRVEEEERQRVRRERSNETT